MKFLIRSDWTLAARRSLYELETSFAVGDGLSYNTEISEVEGEDDEDAGNWLNYLMIELNPN